MMTLNISVKNCNCIRLILMGVLTVTFACKGQEFKKVELPRNYQAKLDIIYAETASWNGKLDFYYPTNNDEPTPVIINIHGGGWNHGKKESQRGFGSFFKKGMAVANVEYRLESEAKAPAAVEDIRCAMSYLISNAEELNIDTDKIVLMGASAGGHLALMGGLSENNSLFDDHCGEREAVKIRAIIDKYGVSDLRPVMFASSVKKNGLVLNRKMLLLQNRCLPLLWWTQKALRFLSFMGMQIQLFHTSSPKNYLKSYKLMG